MNSPSVEAMRCGEGGFVPKERYTSAEFAALEFERLWMRVWQVACRVEDLPRPGDFVEYRLGQESVALVRQPDATIGAFHNTCLHRGTRLLEGSGHLDAAAIVCPYHAWRYDLDGRLAEVVDAGDFPHLPVGLRLAPVQVDSWGGFVWVNFDPDAGPLLDFLDPLPALLGPYRLERMRIRSARSTVLPANWKAVIDAFNEGYHVQGTHPQLLPWTDDTMAYEQIGVHSHYGRLAAARRQLRPSPRLGIPDGEVDEGEILANMVGSLGGLFLADEEALVAEVRTGGPPAGRTLLEHYQVRRMELLESRGWDLDGLTPEQMTSADDVHWFPNMVGPLYPGSAILFRVRPAGDDPGSAIKDTWFLEWPRADEEEPVTRRRFYPDWQAKDWGEITNQDYANLARVQAGMRSRGCRGLWLNEHQEANLIHMHRMLDRYLFA